MTLFQIAAALFAALMIYIVSLHYKKKNLSALEASTWVTVWVVFIVISLLPELLLGIVHTLQFDRVFDLLVVIALMILTSLVFWNYFSHKAVQKKLEQFIRELAIKNAQKK